MGVEITFKRPDGREARGYLSNAARSDAPGLVVIQEWWGPAGVRFPLQGHFASRDDGWVAPKVVDVFERGLRAAGKEFEFFRYDADHAFVNEQRMAIHDRHAAEFARGRATAFLRKHLG